MNGTPTALLLARKHWVFAVALLCASAAAHAFLIVIQAGPRAIYLQVGAGTMTGGTFKSGATPGDNATVNIVSTTVPANAIGAGAQTMSTDSTVANSPYDNAATCTPSAGEVYVGGFYRTPSTSSSGDATLSVATPLNLTNAATGATLPFNTLSWVSGGINTGNPPTLSGGTFTGGASQTLLSSITHNRWFEGCLKFSYANAQFAPAGTFTGRATYTLAAP